MTLLLSALRLDGGTQPRAKIDERIVAEYAEDMRSGAIFPPVVVYFDSRTYWLADGFHRVKAAKAAGREDIEAEVNQGTNREAILYSVGVNGAHGFRRSNADKRLAVERLLNDPEWSIWSDRAIAEACAVGHSFVSNLRSQLSTVDSSRPRMGLDGKERSRPVPARAPRPVVDEMPLEEEPEEPAPTRGPKPEDIPFDDFIERGSASVAEPAEQPTRPEQAINDIRNYIDVILDELDSNSSRHYVVNSTIQYLKSKAITFNRG